MNFLKSVFSDPDPFSDQQNETSEDEAAEDIAHNEEEKDESNFSPEPNANDNSGSTSVWSFGGLIKTLASKSESVIQTYKHDLEEFSSGLRKETEVIREVATRAVKELPGSIEIGASVAQESLESVGQVIDTIGSSVWRGTAEIIFQGKEVLLSPDLESDSSDSQNVSGSGVSLKRYSRFDLQLNALQGDPNTYSENPEDLEDFDRWKLEFQIEKKGEEILKLIGDNTVMEGVYMKLVPRVIDHVTFWTRYFYKVHKLKQVEDVRANLVKRAISGDEEEDLSWETDDDDDDNTNKIQDAKDIALGQKEINQREDTLSVTNVENVIEIVKDLSSDDKPTEIIKEQIFDDKSGKVDLVGVVIDNNESDEKQHLLEKEESSESANNESLSKLTGKIVVEDKGDACTTKKNSDFSVVSSQLSVHEEDDLGWDEIEDIGSGDEKKVISGGISGELRNQLNTSQVEDEDLSWDIEDDEHIH